MRSVLLLLLLGCGAPDVPPPPVDNPTFTEHIEPLLRENCLSCHTDANRGNGGLGYIWTEDGRVDVNGPIDYRIARATALKAACTSITQEVADAYAESLRSRYYGDARTEDGGEVVTVPCGSSNPPWERFSMPPGAGLKLSLEEQVLFVRWIETGAPE